MYKYLIEFLSSIVFVYIILDTGNPLAIGATLAIILLITFSTDIIGCANPAVVIAYAAAGKIPTNEILPYIITEVFGALVALEIYKRFKI